MTTEELAQSPLDESLIFRQQFGQPRADRSLFHHRVPPPGLPPVKQIHPFYSGTHPSPLLTDRGSVQASEVQNLVASAADALEERHVPSHTSSDRRA